MARSQSFSPLWGELHRRGAPVWNQLQNLQSEMNRILEHVAGDSGREYSFSSSYPAVNVWEDADTVFVEAELPGVDEKDLEVYVTSGNQLTIKGQRRPNVPERGVWHRQERACGDFSRSVALPFQVNNDKVEARIENGVLLLKLAKHETAKPRKIPVKGD